MSVQLALDFSGLDDVSPVSNWYRWRTLSTDFLEISRPHPEVSAPYETPARRTLGETSKVTLVYRL